MKLMVGVTEELDRCLVLRPPPMLENCMHASFFELDCFREILVYFEVTRLSRLDRVSSVNYVLRATNHAGVAFGDFDAKSG